MNLVSGKFISFSLAIVVFFFVRSFCRSLICVWLFVISIWFTLENDWIVWMSVMGPTQLRRETDSSFKPADYFPFFFISTSCTLVCAVCDSSLKCIFSDGFYHQPYIVYASPITTNGNRTKDGKNEQKKTTTTNNNNNNRRTIGNHLKWPLLIYISAHLFLSIHSVQSSLEHVFLTKTLFIHKPS